ncbi:Acyl carrier protein AcpP [Streptomyces hundungensis]|uniref:Acyl carrier protein AcpP n=2 Tax=Streptomyces hundungensis TaxID=1077946 RepID=A0A387H5K7_9ACTN|nr:Acyl carrier protein AcpP [Streptomyces hundungensis]
MVMSLEEATTHATRRHQLALEVKTLLVDRLALDVDPASIGDDQPLFGRGLELDSIDTLELAMAVEDTFGVTLTDDNTHSLLSLNRLLDHIQAEQS